MGYFRLVLAVILLTGTLTVTASADDPVTWVICDYEPGPAFDLRDWRWTARTDNGRLIATDKASSLSGAQARCRVRGAKHQPSNGDTVIVIEPGEPWED